MTIDPTTGRPTIEFAGAVIVLMTESDKPRKLIRIIGTLNGKIVDCIIDCGATQCILSSAMARKLKVPITDEQVLVILADGSKQMAKVSEAVDLVIAGRKCKQAFLIIDLSVGDTLIGLDWLTKHDVWIHPRKSRLLFAPPMLEQFDDQEQDLENTKLEQLSNELRGFYTTSALRKTNGWTSMTNFWKSWSGQLRTKTPSSYPPT